MRNNRIAFLTACALSSGALIFHVIFLIVHFTFGIGLIGRKNTFNHEFFNMHFIVYWPIILLSIVVIMSYAIFSGIVYYFFLFTRQLGACKIGDFRLMLRCWLGAYFSVVVINCNLFPNSFFSTDVFVSPVSSWFSINLYHTAFVILFFVLLGAFIVALQKIRRHPIFLSLLLFILAGMIGGQLYAFYEKPNSKKLRMGYENEKPNVIVIYYCSFVAHYLQDYPNFKSFADHSIWFQNVLSPTARSAPGTFEFLSGLYPTNSHFFENLSWRDSRIPYGKSLPYEFQKEGYQTIFITNINAFRRLDPKLSWGFQTIFSPPTNIIGVITAKINDLPLTNLLFCFPFYQYLFPLNYNNADDFVHYRLNDYLAEVKGVLNHHLTRKPLFLVINDESLHFPYVTATMKKHDELSRYKTLMGNVDQQFAQYVVALRKQHLLNNAILIFAADHGESPGADSRTNLLLKAIRETPQDDHSLLLKKLSSDVVFGHGADVMMREQYHVPLIFHFYGNHSVIKMPQINTDLNSTLDVAPTLRQLLNMPAKQSDGISLVPQMEGVIPPSRVLYANSGLNVALPTSAGKMKVLARAMKSLYRVSPDGAFGLDFSFIADLKRNMPLAVYEKNICFFYFPVNESEDGSVKTPSLFGIINEKKFALSLFTRSELENFLQHPDSQKLKTLNVNVNEVQHLLDLVMQYHEKVLQSASGNPTVRIVK
ncbi:MAG: sulfatase-like hydrolase/transferase [Gammaproteobacteria bacterium]|nr:sulfatase-like hydrolase/transferase [Gammaproteobacteria bacterium]